MIEKYEFLTDRIIKVVKEKKRITPTEVSKILVEDVKIVSSTMFYLFKKGVFDKERERRNVFYMLKQK